MGWTSYYRIVLFSEIDDISELNYIEDGRFNVNFYDNTNRILDVNIKRGKSEIQDLLMYIRDQYGIDGYCTVVSTDEDEWPWWREEFEEYQ